MNYAHCSYLAMLCCSLMLFNLTHILQGYFTDNEETLEDTGEINNMDPMQTTDILSGEQNCAHIWWAILYNEIGHVTARR